MNDLSNSFHFPCHFFLYFLFCFTYLNQFYFFLTIDKLIFLAWTAFTLLRCFPYLPLCKFIYHRKESSDNFPLLFLAFYYNFLIFLFKRLFLTAGNIILFSPVILFSIFASTPFSANDIFLDNKQANFPLSRSFYSLVLFFTHSLYTIYKESDFILIISCSFKLVNKVFSIFSVFRYLTALYENNSRLLLLLLLCFVITPMVWIRNLIGLNLLSIVFTFFFFLIFSA